MTSKARAICAATIVFCGVASTARAQQPNTKDLEIQVLDESNRAVKSVVLYKSGGDWLRFGPTDKDGVVRKPFQCTIGTVFLAQPEDSGSYFKSREEDCSQKLRLTVYAKFSGSSQIATVNVGIVKDSKERNLYVVLKSVKNLSLVPTVSPTSAGENCRALGSVKYIREIYQVSDDGKWVPASVLSSALPPEPVGEVNEATVPGKCHGESTRYVETLKENWSAQSDIAEATMLDSQQQALAKSLKGTYVRAHDLNNVASLFRAPGSVASANEE